MRAWSKFRHWKLDVHRPADFHRFRIICLESFRPSPPGGTLEVKNPSSPPGGTCRPVAANKTIFRLIYSFAVLTDGLDTSAAFRRFRLICISSASVPAAVELIIGRFRDVEWPSDPHPLPTCRIGRRSFAYYSAFFLCPTDPVARRMFERFAKRWRNSGIFRRNSGILRRNSGIFRRNSASE